MVQSLSLLFIFLYLYGGGSGILHGKTRESDWRMKKSNYWGPHGFHIKRDTDRLSLGGVQGPLVESLQCWNLKAYALIVKLAAAL